ncbi:MAG: fatty acid desaturase [Myxococcota bacterium]
MAADSPSTGRADVAALMVRRDAPGLVHFGLQSSLLLAAGAVTVEWAGRGDPLWIVPMLVCAVALLAFFPSLHEAGHGTAFATRPLNEIVAWSSAFLMLQAPSFFRCFHWEHHRETQHPERDPEIANARDLLDDWPSNLAVYAFVTSGQALMVGKAGFTLLCALTPYAFWSRYFPFVRDRDAARVAWESRAVAAAWAVVLWLGLGRLPGFAELLLAWPVAHLLLGFYLMPEHTGLPNEGTQLERTRTVLSNPLVRWWMWNMPYHAEHHAHPGVPYHAMPALHSQLRPQLVHVSPGYAAFHRQALRHCLRGGSPSPSIE